MKKIFLAIPMLALMLTACDPSHESNGPGEGITAETLTAGLSFKAKSEGNNNITVYTTPSQYIWVYDATTGDKLSEGTAAFVQVLPPATELNCYVTTINPDGSIVKSGSKSIAVTEYTDLPEIYTPIFGDGNGGFTAHTWVWDTEAADGVWGNGGYLESPGPGWWVVQASDIDGQTGNFGSTPEGDGLAGWMKLGLSGVEISRGETGKVAVNEEHVKDGWDIGTMIFSGTVPLMGGQPNVGWERIYTYHILQADGEHLRLCAPEPGAGDWGTAWFWNFKKK